METIKESNEPMSYRDSNWNSFIDDSKLMRIHSHKRTSSRGLLIKNKQKDCFKSQPNFHRILETGNSHDDFLEADGILI